MVPLQTLNNNSNDNPDSLWVPRDELCFLVIAGGGDQPRFYGYLYQCSLLTYRSRLALAYGHYDVWLFAAHFPAHLCDLRLG